NRNRPALCLGVRAAVSPAISKTLAFYALNGFKVPRAIIAAKRFTVRIAEIELREIAEQVRFRAVLIDAAHAAFEDREEALNRVCVNQAPRIFGNRVVNGVVAGELA